MPMLNGPPGLPWSAASHEGESHDGVGSGDHNRNYTYVPPTLNLPWPFTTRQYGRLLCLRGRLREAPPDRTPAPAN